MWYLGWVAAYLLTPIRVRRASVRALNVRNAGPVALAFKVTGRALARVKSRIEPKPALNGPETVDFSDRRYIISPHQISDSTKRK